MGIVYTAGADQAARAAGVPLNRGNEKSYWQAAIDEVNARGGIAGRRLVPVYEVYEGQSTQTRATQEQAWCARFTQDDRVFAVISVGSMDFEACLARAGVLHPTTGSYVGFDREFYQRYPLYFGQRPSQERLQTDLVSALVRQKYFTGWDTFRGAPGAAKSVVGVLATEEAFITRTVPRVLLPALAKAGHRVDPSAVYHVHSTDAGRASANVQAAVLGFRQKGVTHVVVLDTIGQSTFNFSQQAASQAYYPRLGVTSASGIQQFYDLGVLRPQQVSGVAGLGWTPTLDLPLGQADQYLTKEAPQCLAVMKRRAGVTFDSTTAAGLATMSCDAVFTFAGALQLAGRDLTLATAVRAYEAVGRRLVTATVGRLFFAPTHHDGLEVAYDMVWDNSCTCIRYPDGAHRMP